MPIRILLFLLLGLFTLPKRAAAQVPFMDRATCDDSDSSFSKLGTLQSVFVECDMVDYHYQYHNDTLLSVDVYRTVIDESGIGRQDWEERYTYFGSGKLKSKRTIHYKRKTLISVSDTDTLYEYNEQGYVELKQYLNSSEEKSLTYIYSENGALKMEWKIVHNRYSVTTYGPKGEILDSGSINEKGTGYVNHYDDNGILSTKCYYKNGKLVPKRCIRLRG